jgi:O-antigen ligase
MFTNGIHSTDFENKLTCFYDYPSRYHYHSYYTNQAHRVFLNGNNVSIQVTQELIILSLFIVFLRLSWQIPKQYAYLKSDRLLIHLLQFVIHLSTYTFTLYGH